VKKNSGFTFIEIIVCVVILSAGILGVVGLQARGLKSTVSSNNRAQATALAYSIIDKMRSNRTYADPTKWATDATVGLKVMYADKSLAITNSTTYNANCQLLTASAPPTASCSPADMAVNDLVQWNRELTAQFCGGNGSTDIVCSDNGNKPLGKISYTAPVFTVTISWDENRNGIVDDRDPTDTTKPCYADTDPSTLPALPSPPYDPCFRMSFQL